MLNPIGQAEEVYPYRRVWPSLVLESVILFAVTGVLYALVNLIGVRPPAALTLPANLALALLPAGLWLVASVARERSALEPRTHLITVFVITALAANAIALPFISDFLRPQTWLPLENAINRILGYTLTIGIVQTTTQYLVLRSFVWLDRLRTRTDAVAYAAAAALGYATVLSVRFVLDSSVLAPDVVALRVVENVVVNLAAGLFVAVGLAETRFDTPTPFFMTLMLALGALISGAAQVLFTGLTNAAFSVNGAFARPLFGLGFAIGVMAVALIITSFLFTAAERRDQEQRKQEG